MGIPKFFRYISERWPTILQLIENDQIPEFDNLYLDMNSIFHNCTHGNDIDSTKRRLSEEEVFQNIFNYIDHLFNTIKPKKKFYMAIDGVAPRAKMNQQRSRRFRSAMDAENAMKKAIENGDELPKGEPFDTNSITPGTEFMAKLTKNIKYFIHNKISSDSNWRNIEIIFSGHEVPGEGEHKIMDFIRSIRSLDTYDPNTRHCIYGLDADLIMLGLSTHDPHFALLREEVRFGNQRNSSNNSTLSALDKQNFYLLHLSLLRQYLNLEFKEVADGINFKYDFEKVLDDFILIMFVIGNDFLPNLPDLHLNKGAFPVILQTFKEALLHLDGHINENGKINLQRLSVWLNYLSQFELMNFEKDDIDVEWFNKQLENISLEGERKRIRQGKVLLLKQQKKIVGLVKPWLLKLNAKPISDLSKVDEKALVLELNDQPIVENLDFLKEFSFELGLFIIHSKSKDTYSLKLDIDSINPSETEEEHIERIKSMKVTFKKFSNAILVEDQEELDTEQEIYNERFENWKTDYYKEKFNFFQKERVLKPFSDSSETNEQEEHSIESEFIDRPKFEYIITDDENKLTELCKNYVEGLQWVLYYYYRGCPSWNWYYKYHYAPRISDLTRGLDQTTSFDLSNPFTPFEQLMAVLPERSKNLIPPVLRPLMYEEISPILDLYPNEVELDKNGKTADWEAVVLLPFVDENRLIDAMKPHLAKLSPEEKERNQFGKDLTFMFSPQVDEVYKTPLGGLFNDIEHNHCVEIEFKLEKIHNDKIRYGLLPNAKIGKDLLAGFPSLFTIPFKNNLEYNETTVFQQPSRQQSMVLKIQNIYEENNMTAEEFGSAYLNKIVYTKWPYLRESKVLEVFNEHQMMEVDINSGKSKSRPLNDSERKLYMNLRSSIFKNYNKSKAVNVGKVSTIVKVLPVNGLMRDTDGAYIKTYSNESEYYPLQLVVETVSNVDERYLEKPPQPIEEEFPQGSKVIFLGDYAYGGTATIDGYSSSTRLKLSVEKRSLRSEPTIGKSRCNIDKDMVKYQPSYVVARNLKLQSLFLSRLTSKFLVADINGSHVNVGIPIKFEARSQKVLGFARKNPRGWEFSNLAVDLLVAYRKNFPDFIEKLSRVNTRDKLPSIEELYPELDKAKASALLANVKSWIKSVTDPFVTVSLQSDSLTKASILAVEDFIEPYSKLPEESETKHLAKVPREAVLDPKSSFTLLRSQRFDLGDRVVYIQDTGKVPLFSKGTVVGYTTLGQRLSVQVLFDHEIVSGNKFGGRLRTNRGLGLDASFLLNITNRQFIYHSKASKKVGESTRSVAPTAASIEARKHKAAQIRTARAKDLLTHINVDKKEKTEVSELKESLITSSMPPARNVANHVYSAVLNQVATDPSDPANNQPAAPQNVNGVEAPGLPYHLPPVFVPPPMIYPNMVTGQGPPMPMNSLPPMPPYHGNLPPPVTMYAQNQFVSAPAVDEKGSKELKSFIKGGKKKDSKKDDDGKRPKNKNDSKYKNKSNKSSKNNSEKTVSSKIAKEKQNSKEHIKD
ncbi:hypothetical protein Kpol_541p40 [Vanderwaltozyma polyspora DSM 70294]|uniref:5'-3' exoribonuclease 1 n=1 Tax=Vanderwaltozyma polyspora (strain ATCC 22028 / DSM 70294 / BCRC 21397 / CBS 2163 / NBRC 10782 / NRRL Y-8283 / UCD 57-17) TaxID=436907 RepID=A7TIY6_VANPO|nr:uncharacterized protein Kpol_541p40 [Vanderwaltozyma polyspora DSM 70294]EDO17798.1 hypothetical protein Kpol_541p40 [Vanderwaltozyma polyspora DSM 70294]